MCLGIDIVILSDFSVEFLAFLFSFADAVSNIKELVVQCVLGKSVGLGCVSITLLCGHIKSEKSLVSKKLSPLLGFKISQKIKVSFPPSNKRESKCSQEEHCRERLALLTYPVLLVVTVRPFLPSTLIT